MEKGLTILYQPGGLFDSIYYVERVYVHKKSAYQDIMIVDIRGFGKSLVLDGLLQSSVADEYFYHEFLVHPAMVAHPRPRLVLILGGGEGATLREVLKHPTVEEVVMVDIDEEVIELSKKYLPELHQGSFDDPRSRIVIMDGFKYIEKSSEEGRKFDVVIMDLTDPYGSEITQQLYSTKAFSLIKKILNEEGIIVTQAGSSMMFPKAFQRVEKSMKEIFRYVYEYCMWIPSFAYVNSFLVASDSYRVFELTPEEVDKRLTERNISTRVFTGDLFWASLLLAKARFSRGTITTEKKVE